MMGDDEFLEGARSGFPYLVKAVYGGVSATRKRLFFREIPAARGGGSGFSAYQFRIWE
jgi:hypothetical protein